MSEIPPAATSGTRGVDREEPLSNGPPTIEAPLEGRYEVGELIGRGGMGWVFEGTDLRLQRTIAIKIMREALARDPAHARRFEREALAASRLNSPYVVVVHDFGRVDDTLFLVMERLRGDPLGKLLKAHDDGLGLAHAVSIARDVARGLVAAHESDIVHRDLKPGNVFVTGDGAAKVLDFGIAKIAGGPSSASLTSTGMILGTPLYMSPEAIKKRALVGPPSDVYALGVILYAMIAGVPPYYDEEPVVIMNMPLSRPVPSVAKRRPDLPIPEELDLLVARCLAKTPDARPTAAEIVEALTALEAAGLPATGEADLPPIPEEPHAPSPNSAQTEILPVHAHHADTGATPTPAIAEEPPTPAPSQPPATFVADPPPEEPEGRGAPPIALIGVAIALVLLLAGFTGWWATKALEGDDESDGMVATELTTPDVEPAPAPEPPPPEPAAEPPPEAAADDAPAPAPEPEPRGTLSLRTDEPAEVFVDGRSVGEAPVSVELAPGTYAVRVQGESGRRSLQVTIEDGETATRRVTMSRPRPSRRGRSAPADDGDDLPALPEEW